MTKPESPGPGNPIFGGLRAADSAHFLECSGKRSATPLCRGILTSNGGSFHPSHLNPTPALPPPFGNARSFIRPRVKRCTGGVSQHPGSIAVSTLRSATALHNPAARALFGVRREAERHAAMPRDSNSERRILPPLPSQPHTRPASSVWERQVVHSTAGQAVHRRCFATPGLDSGVDASLCHRTP